MKNNKYILSISLIITAVISNYFVTVSTAQQEAPQQVDNEYQIGAILFHQKAAEYRALTYQAFNLAKMRLDMDKKLSKKLPKSERKKPRAIVIDADETVLDNSPYQAKLARENKAFSIEDFFEWKKSGKSKAVPGAVEFLNYARKKGVEIFYVSNVPDSFKQVTIESLKQNGFPDAREENVMLITDSSSKEPRRQKVAETHRIIMFIGDSLNDLSVVFEGRSTAERFAEVEKAKDLWGTKFIVIPNVMYGAWEGAIYQGEKLDEAGKAKKRVDSMEVFQSN
jgi:5'-nucleotidase (lipoprotein e(P4) family)